MKTIRCIVACINSNGEPDLFFLKLDLTSLATDYENAVDYAGDSDEAFEQIETIAKSAALNEGYEGPFIVFDEICSAGISMLKLFEWNTASVFDVSGKEIK